MKKFMYFLSLVILFASCKSVQKLVDKGEYDQAIELAARKLHGQKNRKTKHVRGLETAFAKITKRDMDYIHFLKDQNRPENWANIYDRLQKIKNRQYKIEPFLPLVSKDGYIADFKLVRVDPLIIEAADMASAHHYELAESLLNRSGEGDKIAARQAYDELRSIGRYNRYYKNSEQLMSTALDLGKTRVLVKSGSSLDAYLPQGFHDELLRVNVTELNSRWQEFYTYEIENVKYDLHALLEIEQVDVSPEREKERIYVESKEIKDGTETVYDRRGNAVKDSLGNEIKTDRYRTITARISELKREKAATVKGHFKVVDTQTGQVLDRRPIVTEKVFKSYASKFNGDRRAMTSNSIGRLRRHAEPFPSDFDLLWQTAEEMKKIMKEELRKNIL